MLLGTGSGTSTLIATLSAIASIGGMFAYLYFAQRGAATSAREEAVALAETRRQVIADLRRRLAEANERCERVERKYVRRVRDLEQELVRVRGEARDRAYQVQRLYAVGLVNVLEGVRSDLIMAPPNVEGALERIRNLLSHANSTVH